MKSPGLVTIFFALVVVLSAGAQEAGVAPTSPTDSAQWYVTDSDLIVREPTDTGDADAATWTAAIDTVRRPGGRRDERAYLYNDGLLVAIEQTQFNPAGLPLFRGRYDATGEIRYEEHFRYRTDGSLREVRRCNHEGKCITVRYGLPSTAWDEHHWGPDYKVVYRYDDGGRPEYVRREENGVVIREEWYTYTNSELTERRIRNGNEEYVHVIRNGLVVEETHRRRGRAFRVIQREFNNDGAIMEERVTENGTVRLSRYEYDGASDDGGYRLLREIDGVRVLEETRDGSGSGTTTRYRNGEIVVRETYKEEELVRRETFADGEVIRTEEW